MTTRNDILLRMLLNPWEDANEVRALINKLWPDLESVPDGADPFPGEPVAGVPDEELSRLVADGWVDPDHM